jgi:hypothetical protein
MGRKGFFIFWGSLWVTFFDETCGIIVGIFIGKLLAGFFFFDWEDEDN